MPRVESTKPVGWLSACLPDGCPSPNPGGDDSTLTGVTLEYQHLAPGEEAHEEPWPRRMADLQGSPQRPGVAEISTGDKVLDVCLRLERRMDLLEQRLSMQISQLASGSPPPALGPRVAANGCADKELRTPPAEAPLKLELDIAPPQLVNGVPTEAPPTDGKLKKSKSKSMDSLHMAKGWLKPEKKDTRKALEEIEAHTIVEKICHSPWFQVLSCFMIFCNIICIAVETNTRYEYKMSLAMAREGTSIGPTPELIDKTVWLVLDFIFMVWLAFELVVNVWAERGFVGPNAKWNMFDLVIFVYTICQFSMEAADLDVMNVGGLARVARLMRLFRLAKIMRVLRIFKYLHSLRKMILSMLGSIPSLFWALFLLFMMMFVLSVLVLQGIEVHLDSISVAAPAPDGSIERNMLMDGIWLTHLEALHKYYGDVGTSMLTFFHSISGGDWFGLASVVRVISPVFLALWVTFICFVLFGVLNILTGIFVDSAMMAGASDHDSIIEEELSERDSVAGELKELFELCDKDNSGEVTEREFEGLLENPKVHALFNHLGLSIQEASGLFKLLDEEQDGAVAIEEFIGRCMRLKGPAKALDMVSMLYENNRVIEKIANLMEEFKSLKVRLDRLTHGHPHHAHHAHYAGQVGQT